MANIYYQNQQYVIAEKIYLELLEDQPRNQYILECLAWVYYQFGVKQKVKQYVDSYEREAGGTTHNSRFLRINSLPWNQQYQTTLRLQVQNKTWRLVPNYYDKLHWYSQARLHDPTLPILNAKMSIILSKLGGRQNFDLSFQYADGALELMPDDKEDMFLWYAIDFLNMMAEENPSDVKVVLPQMQLHLRQAPYNLEMHVEMALVYLYLEMDDEAIQFFLRCRRLNPYESSFRTVLGTLYRKKGNFRKAKQCFESALRLNSCDAAAMMELIMTKIQLMEIIVE